VARLRSRLSRGESLPDALAAERAAGEPAVASHPWPLERQSDEPLSPADAVAREYGLERERSEQIALRRRLGPRAWRELVVSGKFFRPAQTADTSPRQAAADPLGL